MAFRLFPWSCSITHDAALSIFVQVSWDAATAPPGDMQAVQKSGAVGS